MSRASTVAKSAAIIAAGTLLSRLLGLIRERMMLTAFGTSYIAGAFNSAFSVPDLLYYLLAGGALSAAFIPVFADHLAKDDQEGANRTGSSIANLMVLALIIGVVLEFIFSTVIVRYLVAPGYKFGSPEFNLTVSLTRVLCVIVVFTAISGLFSGMLNSYHHFFMPTLVWIVYNLVIIFGISVLTRVHWHGQPLGIYGVAIGIVLGAICMAVLQIPMAYKFGFRYRTLIDLKHPGTRRVLQLFVPVMIGLSLGQLNLQFIPLQIGSFAGPAAVTLLRAANRIVLLPLGIFAVAVATAAFPRLSQQVSLGEMREFRDTVNRALKAILLLAVPSAVAIFVLAGPVTGLLWGGGKFGPQDIDGSAYILTYLGWGLIALSALQLINRAFFSLQDTLTPVILGILMVGGNIGLGIFLTKYTPISFGGAAVSTSLTTTVCTLVLFEILRRRLHGIGGRSLAIFTGKIVLASAVMGAAVYFVAAHFAPVLSDGQHTLTLLPNLHFRLLAPHMVASKELASIASFHVPLRAVAVQVGASMVTALVVFFGMLFLLRVEETSFITERVIKRFRRNTSSSCPVPPDRV